MKDETESNIAFLFHPSSLILHPFRLPEGAGFEPARHREASDALAARRNQPLCQPSNMSQRTTGRRERGRRGDQVERKVEESNFQAPKRDGFRDRCHTS